MVGSRDLRGHTFTYQDNVSAVTVRRAHGPRRIWEKTLTQNGTVDLVRDAFPPDLGHVRI